MHSHVIGMFDSGVGGLTVMKEILEQIPNARIIYFGDTARVPYGNRSREELIRFGEQIIAFLISQGAEAVAVACNTSSANAVPVLNEIFGIPLIGTIGPGARSAVKVTQNGKIGVIATEATVRSKAYVTAVSRALNKGILPDDRKLREAWQREEKEIALVKAQSCPLFVPLVEAGLAGTPEAKGIAKTYLTGIQAAGVDTLILGCTHYPFLTPVIKEILGESITLVDPAQAMVEELSAVLRGLETTWKKEDKLSRLAAEQAWNGFGLDELKPAPEPKSEEQAAEIDNLHFFVSGDPELFRQVGDALLPGRIRQVRQINLEE